MSTTSDRPVALVPVFDSIPAELRETPAWVLWRYELDGKGKWTKPPCASGGGRASTTKPSTWATFDAVRERYGRGGFDGVGFVLTNGIAGVDLDKCITVAGEIEAWAAETLEQFTGTYRERSPSGRGFRIFTHGNPARCGKGGPEKRLEVYAKESPRYLTVTGHALDDVREIVDGQDALDWLHATHMAGGSGHGKGAPADDARQGATLSDDAVIAHARKARNGAKFMDLWAGGHAGHASASDADASLIGLLTFYTQDPVQLDRLFRRSGLMRDKWDEPRGETTYGAMTIANILAKLGQHFGDRTQGHRSHANGAEGIDTHADAQDAPEADSGAPAWPEPLADEAFHGIAGELVSTIEPETEADPAAILLQVLTAFGSLVGRGPHVRVEGDRHYANLYLLLVGATAKGRKGTSWSRVREVFEKIEEWKRHVSGLSSGEGLKYHVRDPREELTKTKKGEQVLEVVDAGVDDKRLLVVESEFASVLRAVQRQGNTLSATVREAWDTGNLRTLTKNDPITATDAHISIVGHITADELRAELTGTETANGFLNRFLLVAVKRSKLLPFGGATWEADELHAFASRLRDRAVQARMVGAVGMTDEARTMWAKVYPELSGEREGLHGAVTARAEAQCIRLALLYCLLDGANAIEPTHLLAALAVWQYCDDTVRFIFGSSLGDRIADEIMRRLKVAGADGLTRDDLRNAFQRHVPAERIGAALDLLQRRGKAACEKVRTAGRPSEVWRATK